MSLHRPSPPPHTHTLHLQCLCTWVPGNGVGVGWGGGDLQFGGRCEGTFVQRLLEEGGLLGPPMSGERAEIQLEAVGYRRAMWGYVADRCQALCPGVTEWCLRAMSFQFHDVLGPLHIMV